MRRVYLFVLGWSTLSAAMAQTQSSFSQAFDAAFATLVQIGITSGIIYDRVFPAANLRESGNPAAIMVSGRAIVVPG